MRLLEVAGGASVEGTTGDVLRAGCTRRLTGVDNIGTTGNSEPIPPLILLTLVFSGGGVNNTLVCGGTTGKVLPLALLIRVSSGVGVDNTLVWEGTSDKVLPLTLLIRVLSGAGKVSVLTFEAV
jgi:hypothetical protein